MSGGNDHAHPLDAHTHLHSLIHQWDVRYKIVGLIGLIFAFALVQSWRLIPLLIVLSLVVVVISRLPWQALLKQLSLPTFFIALFVILLPFTNGKTVWGEWLGIKIYREGMLTALLVLVRFYSILTLSFVLFATSPFLHTLNGLRALGLPLLLADMLLLTYRYLFAISDDFQQMWIAARMRGFELNRLTRFGLTTLASLLGHLFVRSYAQSERIYHAMILRGYGATKIRPNQFHATRRDFIQLAMSLSMAVGILVLQFLWTH